MVLKGLILNNFHFGGGCGHLERTDFFQCSLCEGVVDLK